MEEKNSRLEGPVAELIEAAVRESVAPYAVQNVVVTVGQDHDGDEVLFVSVRYRLSKEAINTSRLAPLTSIVRDRLWAAGEKRFPHIKHTFDEHQIFGSGSRRRA